MPNDFERFWGCPLLTIHLTSANGPMGTAAERGVTF
jgi:hypothetical protein